MAAANEKRGGVPGFVVVLVFLLGAGAGALGWYRLGHAPTAATEAAKAGEASAGPRFHCPMHPTYTDDHASNCPICGMKLVPIPSGPTKGAGKGVAKDSALDATPTALSGAPTPAEGLETVEISTERRQLLGVRTVPAAEQTLTGGLRTTARVAADESRVRRVTIKFDGFIEKLHITTVGQTVKKGQPLLAVYSPEVVAAETELLVAQQSDADSAATGSASSKLGEAARQRLALWDVGGGTVAAVLKAGKPQRELTIYAPMSGTVTSASAVLGSKVAAGEPLFDLTDLGQLWAIADVRAPDVDRVQLGMKAQFRLTGSGHAPYPGEVKLIEPAMDPKTRTLRVRVQISNEDGSLHPEAFGEIELLSEARTALVVPSDAILDSGRQQVVFVERDGGQFEPRVIKTGAATGDFTEVVSGLQAGERVVTRAAFLLDSESRLKAALSSLASSPSASPGSAP